MVKFIKVSHLGIFFIPLLYSCQKNDDIYTPVEDIAATYDNTPYRLEYGNFPTPALAPDNPLTIEGVKLGRMLFYEKRFSRDNSMACADCHKQANAFSDIRRFSIGVDGLPGKRQSMAIFNTAWHSNEFFWDGRAHLLRDQALKPIEDPLELNETLPRVISKLSQDPAYKRQFIRAFNSSEINSSLISKALEQFMNSIISNRSKYDKYLAGTATLTPEEERGRFLFFTEFNPYFPDNSGADCVHCHSGINFENDDYMNNGLDNDAGFTDLGRFDVTRLVADKAKFKVPSLRNIELTPPYMHDGRLATLEAVVEHYNLVKNSSTLDGSFQQQLPNGLRLSNEDKQALVSFLKTLTDNELKTDSRYSSPF